MEEDTVINKEYWTFIKMLSEYDSFLSIEGSILKCIVLSKGRCNSISSVARELNKHVPTVWRKCKKMEEARFIKLCKEGNCCRISFSEKALSNTEGLM